MVLEIIDNGRLQVSFQQYGRHEGFHKNIVIGVVEEPLVSKCLFSGYLNVNRPMNQKARDASIESLVGLF
ncbi:unnamed protein product [Ambrosiozyma monospora]|uniref:Unnamed protein product n=1 Tax=Ambrosiozyma monospora TaxID=43982 RepID=A0ACB5U4Q3_AMBMO|nr:unnamed protein product [Ambrosiozyma monospora]